METKLLITLDVASISQSFEVLVPDFLKIKELIPLFVKIAEELSGNMYQSSGTEFLCSCAENTLLDSNSTGRVPDQKRRSFHSVVRGGTA